MKEGKLMKKKWKRVNLGSLLNRISNGISVKQQSELREGYLPVSRIETIAKGVIDLNRVKYIEATPEVVEKYLLRSGDILLSHINSDKHLGKVAIVEDGIELLHGINLLLLRCNDDVFPKFLFYQLWLIRLTGGFIDIAQRSVNQSSVNQKKVKAIEVIVPSIADQKMVTYKLDSFFEKHRTLTTSLTRLPALLADFREAVLRKAFRNFKDNKVFLKNLLLEKPKNGIYKPKSFYGRGTKIVRIDKFYDGELKGTWDDMQRVEITSKELSQFGLKNDEILINRVNSMTHLGKCLLIDGLVDECVFESNMMRLKLDEEIVLPRYVKYYLSSPLGYGELRKNAKQAVNQASINQTDVGQVVVPLPSLSEQRKIVNHIESLFAIADRIEAKMETLNSQIEDLPQAILAKAFRGDL